MKKIKWNGEVFFSAAEAGRLLGRRAGKIVKDQPGYQRGRAMCVMVSKGGGNRLYVDVCGNWMDGSLDDIKGGA
jgi:hypothetical protein